VLIRHRAPICATVLLAAVFWASICASRPSGTTTPARHRPVPPAAAEDYKVSRRMAAPHQQSFPLPRRFHQDDGFTPNNQDPFTVGRRSLIYC
jgi:hypothetical protein